MIPESDTKMTDVSRRFICGVVEGFYGRPWSNIQRQKLFKRMKKMGMNTFMYAPKDDSKHRMYWRTPYTVEEADTLTSLIEAAEENDVTFVYALSPGLDMTYSSTREMNYLKRKLTQVASFGCKAFALLFDDIEKDMCDEDRRAFQSFASAHVAVTNEIYQYLHKPETFFFCPTEYCGTRAIPTVSSSEYLRTTGSRLHPNIDIMWTGPNVISKKISVESILEVSRVLRRPPLIWDNIHANDYDSKRIFLGPYGGRSPELIPYLRGVLTNPNCEFESNYIALHTLAQWSKLSSQLSNKDSEIVLDQVINLEMNCSDSSTAKLPRGPHPHNYVPHQALQKAVADWYSDIVEDYETAQKLATATLLSSEIMKSIEAAEVQDSVQRLNDISLSSDSLNSTSQLDILPCEDTSNMSFVNSRVNCIVRNLGPITANDMTVLVELFYMPFEHGQWGMETVLAFHWLKMNSMSMQIVKEWEEKCQQFIDRLRLVIDIIDRLISSPFKELVYELFPYVWDMKAIFILLIAFVQWLKISCNRLRRTNYIGSLCQMHSWLGKEHRKLFSSDGEPWVFKGGLLGEFQRMLPFERCTDLLLYACPGLPQSVMFNIRPYSSTDTDAVYAVFEQMNKNDSDETELCTGHKNVDAHSLVDAYLDYSPEMCFIVEDSEGVCGCILAADDAKSLCEKVDTTISESRENTTLSEKKSSSSQEFSQDCIPDTLIDRHPSLVHIGMIPDRMVDFTAPVRLLACAVAALKATGSCGIYTTIKTGNQFANDFYRRLGFIEIPYLQVPEKIFMGRPI